MVQSHTTSLLINNISLIIIIMNHPWLYYLTWSHMFEWLEQINELHSIDLSMSVLNIWPVGWDGGRLLFKHLCPLLFCAFMSCWKCAHRSFQQSIVSTTCNTQPQSVIAMTCNCVVVENTHTAHYDWKWVWCSRNEYKG